MMNGKKKEDSRCIEALDTQEFTVVPILKSNLMTDCFKVGILENCMISLLVLFVRLHIKQSLLRCVKNGFLYFVSKINLFSVC